MYKPPQVKYDIIRHEPETELVDVMQGAGSLEIKVGEHGSVALMDVMPRLVPKGKLADFAIVQAARTSYGDGTKTVSEDRGLVRYLSRHRHTTPLEMVEFKFRQVMPVFVARQWIRHRTACLAGNTQLTFDEPSALKGGRYKSSIRTVAEIFDRWQPTANQTRPDKQRNELFKRDRIQAMNLRSVNEETGEIYHTHITDIWSNGIKKTVKVFFENGLYLQATTDHLCFTDKGWLKLEEALKLDASFASCGKKTGFISEPPIFTQVELDQEVWAPVLLGYEGRYEVSNLGRVRSWVDYTGEILDQPTLKTITILDDGYAAVSLSKAGKSRVFHVHHLVLNSFQSAVLDAETRHLDNNRQHNRIENLAWGTLQENVADRILSGCDQKLCQTFQRPIKVEDGSDVEVFDLSVSGPFHNFLAGGVFVHNSVNEYSARYSVVKDRYFRPSIENIRTQSKANKQGGEEPVDEMTATEFLAWLDHQAEGQQQYEKFCEKGIAREMARCGLPLTMFTEWYWKIDLHNLFHFLGLRMDNHAQQEIRDYSFPMFELIKPFVPDAAQAFLDYHPNMDAMLLTGPELQAINGGELPSNKRELEEFKAKLSRMGITKEFGGGPMISLIDKITKRLAT